jgi:hypothetical protein
MISTQSSDLSLLRKPSGIASIPGKEASIFEILKQKNTEKILQRSFDEREGLWSSL